MSKIVKTDDSFLQDFQGGDALSHNTDDLKDKVTRFANAAMPQVLRKALFIVQNSKNEKSVIEAAKLIKLIADGTVKGKLVDGMVKKLSNEDIVSKLDGYADEAD